MVTKMNRKLSVLIIEDTLEDAELNASHLKNAGYEISYHFVDSANGMKKALEKQKWDLILFDNSIPEFDASTALAICQESHADIPFIIISGTISEEKAVELIKAGAKDYLLKNNMTRVASIVERELREALVRRELIQSNIALKASEEKYRSYVENAPDGVFVVDGKGRYLEVNKAAMLITGYTEQELLGMSVSDLLPPDTAEWILKYLKTVTKKGFATGEWKFIRKDGTQRWWSLDTIILTKTQFLVFSKDITERKKFELEFRNTNKQLELLNQYLIEAREDERTLISMQIHDELGQSLTALKLDLCWILKNIQDRENTVEKLKKMVEMTNTIIKKVQRISAEIHPSMLEDLGLASTIEWYCGEFEERTGLKCNLTLEDLTSGNPQSTLALFRILQEALTNVIRHSEASNVNIELRNSENQIILTIEDDGIGISPEKIKSYSSLGLVGMFERARQCGGKVEFAPKESQGTKLIITIDGPENNYS